MGEIQSKTSQMKCVFDSNIECPVRKEIQLRLETQKQLSKYIEPLGDKELMEIFIPFIDKLEESFQNEFSFLHFYCNHCPQKFQGDQ